MPWKNLRLPSASFFIHCLGDLICSMILIIDFCVLKTDSKLMFHLACFLTWKLLKLVCPVFLRDVFNYAAILSSLWGANVNISITWIIIKFVLKITLSVLFFHEFLTHWSFKLRCWLTPGLNVKSLKTLQLWVQIWLKNGRFGF